MAPPAQAHVRIEPAEGAFDSIKVGDADDWVSLILSDVGADVAEEDNPISVAALSSLPLPDLDDVDFSNLDGSVSSHEFSSEVLFGPSEILQEGTEVCPSLHHPHSNDSSAGHPYTCPHLQHPEVLAHPSFPQCSLLAKENAMSQSPESGLSHASPEYPDGDTNILVMDSCSDEDSFYFLVSDMCVDDTSSTEVNPCNAIDMTVGDAPIEHSKGSEADDTLAKMDSLQTSSSQQNYSIVPEKANMPSSRRDTSRKRKHLDRVSRSSTPEGEIADCQEQPVEGTEVVDEEEERRRARLMRNRESAQLSRQRKKIYVDELEEKIKTMASTIAELNNTISLISAENINLRRQLGMFGPQPGQPGAIPGAAPWMGAYPPGPMVGGRFMVPGPQVPLVPIPKWKSQQSTTVTKTRKPKPEPREKGGLEKAAKKTKKVAGVAAAGLFFFVFILLPVNLQFLGVRPTMHRESKVWPATPLDMGSSNVVVRAGGRVLTGLSEERSLNSNEQGSGRGYIGSGAFKAGGIDHPQELETCDHSDADRGDGKPDYKMNGSIPLAATLFVPKNDQLVRIEGNLIINSVLAGYEAADSLNQTDRQSVRPRALHDRSSALNANLKAVALKAAPKERGALVELQRALAGRLRFDWDGSDVKSVKEDGSLQQWFVEDFTGPIFSSGMCTEVFQFETSPAASSSSPQSGSHVRKANDLLKNETAWLPENGPRKAGRSVPYSRKSPSYAVPLPPVGHKVMFNATSSNNSAKGRVGADNDFAEQKHTSSSVVVSVLAGPELGEHSKLTGGRKLSRFFVVVLIDSIKYVTYSCMLPSAPGKSPYEVVVP